MNDLNRVRGARRQIAEVAGELSSHALTKRRRERDTLSAWALRLLAAAAALEEVEENYVPNHRAAQEEEQP